MKKTILLVALLSTSIDCIAQKGGSTSTDTSKVVRTQTIKKDSAIVGTAASTNKIEFERPFNFFAAAGASYMFGDQYSVVVSPVDYTVQFEKTFPILTRFSLGLVWNPIPDKSNENIQNFVQQRQLLNVAYKAAREHMAIALLVNIFQLGYSANEFSSTTPIDVGFGLGYRNSNFLILGTLELTPMRSPRKYFTDEYLDKNKPLILFGAKEPIRTISIDDSSLFHNRIYPSIGLKIAYAFSKESSPKK